MHFFFYFIVTCISILNSLQAESDFKIIDLSPPGSVESYATDINEHGQVVGLYLPEGSKKMVTFIWDKENGFVDLGEYENQYWKTLCKPKINNLGHVVGCETLPGNFFSLGYSFRRPFFWSPERGKIMMDFSNDARAGDIEAVSFNDHNQAFIHMFNYFENQYQSIFNFYLQQPYAGKILNSWLWQEDQYEEIDNFQSFSTHNEHTSYLSNQQTITGAQRGIFEESYTPIFYDHQNKIEIVIPFPKNMNTGWPLTINDNNEVLLEYKNLDLVSSSKSSYYAWNPIEGLVTIPYNFKPIWINNQGLILGTFEKMKTKQIVLYDGQNIINVSTAMIDSNFHSLDILYKVNDRKQIVGTGRLDPQGKPHAFLIEPKEKN